MAQLLLCCSLHPALFWYILSEKVIPYKVGKKASQKVVEIEKRVDRVRKYRYTVIVVLIKKAGLPHLGTYL